MTYYELFTKAENLLIHNKISLGEYDKMVQPLNEEVRKEGHWIRDGHHIRCSECSEYICDTDREGDTIPQNFCPNCGSKMKGE